MANPGDNNNRIYQQIEADADYYEPSIYSALKFHHQFEAQDDLIGQDFIPLASPSAYRFGESTNTGKMFVVGILPPTCNVSGRLLDRSASIANIQGGVAPADLGPEEAFSAGKGMGSQGPGYWGGAPLVTAPGYTIPVSSGSSNIGVEVPGGVNGCHDHVGVITHRKGEGPNEYPCTANLTIPQIYQGLHDAYVRKFGKEPTATEIQFYTAQCMRETSGNFPGNNPGYIGNSPTNPGGWVGFEEPDPKNPGQSRTRWFKCYDSTGEGFDAYLGIVSSNPNVSAAARDGDALGFMTALAQRHYYGEPVSVYYNMFPQILSNVAAAVPQAGLGSGRDLPKSAPPGCAFTETAVQYQKRAQSAGIRSGVGAIARFQSNSPYGPDCPLDTSAADDPNSQTPNWNPTGADNAQEAKKVEVKTADLMDLNRTGLGQAFLWAQRAEIKETQQQLEIMKNTPPLRMLVNPTSFKVSAEKIVSDSNWTRNGAIIEHWGDSQDKIAGSGKIAGFYSIDQQDASNPGLARTTRNYSMSYQNFLSLWLLYRSNAGILLSNGAQVGTPDYANFLSVLGSIYIYYDGILYLGSFDSFNVSESDTAPFTLEYDFAFTVRAWFELDREDPEQYRYGNEGMFKLGTIPVAPDATKTYEASRAAAEQRLKEAEAMRLAAEPGRKALDDLFRSPDEVMGTETGTGKPKGNLPIAKGNQGGSKSSQGSSTAAPAKTSAPAPTYPPGYYKEKGVWYTPGGNKAPPL